MPPACMYCALGSPGLDRLLAAAQVHPQMEIRLFNAMARGPLPGLARLLDLLAFGPLLEELGQSFDPYCNAELASPVAGWASLRADAAALEALRVELLAHEEAQAGTRYAGRVGSSNLHQDAKAGKLELLWAPTRAVADLPEKIVARGTNLRPTLLSLLPIQGQL